MSNQQQQQNWNGLGGFRPPAQGVRPAPGAQQPQQYPQGGQQPPRPGALPNGPQQVQPMRPMQPGQSTGMRSAGGGMAPPGGQPGMTPSQTPVRPSGPPPPGGAMQYQQQIMRPQMGTQAPGGVRPPTAGMGMPGQARPGMAPPSARPPGAPPQQMRPGMPQQQQQTRPGMPQQQQQMRPGMPQQQQQRPTGPPAGGPRPFGGPPSSFQQQGPQSIGVPGSGPSIGGAPGMRPAGFGSFGGGPDTMAATLDAFETLNLGAGGPSMPGPPGSAPGQQQTANAATFPRPAGNLEQYHEAVGAPKPPNPANSDHEFVRFTSNAVPNSQALKSRWQLPYGAVVHPLAETEKRVPIANAGHTTIVRCKRCRTYMNPFMVWMDGGRRFSCNVCQMVNECPVEYYCALDASGRRLDHEQRPELSHGSVEYVAPAEYMVRAPMPPTFVFVIDVSFAAASSGMLASACASIKSILGKLPGDDRTRVALITFDKSIHFYNMRPGLSSPQMLVVGELEDPFVPLPDELLVNLSESKDLLEQLLDSLPSSFAHTQIVDSAMGPALQAAFLVMNHVGGKLMLFQAGAPSVGIGRIKARDNPALYGTDREYTLRCPDDPFYKRFSAEASRFQICIDVFACGSAYMDLPSIGALPKYTGGQCYYYPGFNKDKDGLRLASELERNVTRETAWEAVMRIRCSKGLRISSFYGHFFVRSTDLLALPACDADKSFAVEITHEETLLTGQTAYMQAALLYTSSQGERRIRVHTCALPIVSEMIDLYKGCDAGCTIALMGKVSVEKSYSSKLDVVRGNLQQMLTNALKEYRLLHMRGTSSLSPGSMVLPERLKSLPVLTLGLLKSAALRGSGRDVNTDERAAVGHHIATGCVESMLKLVYPSFYRVDTEQGAWGQAVNGKVVLPPSSPAGLEYCDPTGAYIIDTGRVMILWIGSGVSQQFYVDVFGNEALSRPNEPLQLTAPKAGSKLGPRIHNVVSELKKGREVQQDVHVVRQGTPLEAHVVPYFVEDRMGTTGLPSYLDWMTLIQKTVMSK